MLNLGKWESKGTALLHLFAEGNSFYTVFSIFDYENFTVHVSSRMISPFCWCFICYSFQVFSTRRTRSNKSRVILFFFHPLYSGFIPEYKVYCLFHTSFNMWEFNRGEAPLQTSKLAVPLQHCGTITNIDNTKAAKRLMPQSWQNILAMHEQRYINFPWR